VISMRELIAWRQEVPWTRDALVEQDLLLTRVMAAVFTDPFLESQVAMRGGTVLHKVHLPPAARYSEDIDLVLVGERPVDHVRQALLRILRPLLGTPSANILGTVQLAIRNLVTPSKIVRQVYGFRPTVPPPPTAQIKIEVNYTETTPCFPLQLLAYAPASAAQVPPFTLRTYDLDELLGTKLRALRQRAQGRDLFDLWHAWIRSSADSRTGGVDPERVARALAFYLAREDMVPRRRDFERDLSRKLRARAFHDDVGVMLQAAVGWDPGAAADVVRDVFLAALPG
jgi:predicted nucleotidyltransferase component of viral defense system